MKWSRERDKQKEERESFGNFTDFVYDMEIVVVVKSYTYTMYLSLSLSTINYFSILVQQIYAL